MFSFKKNHPTFFIEKKTKRLLFKIVNVKLLKQIH